MSTAIVGHRTQPHDPFDTGKIGTELLIRIVAGEVKPVTAWRKIPLISHQEQFLTSQGPMKVWFDRARALEADPRVLQASNFPMQPWLDVAEGGWATVVVTDGDQALAEQLADELADLAWSMRDDFQVQGGACRSTRRCAWPMRAEAASSCSAIPATRCSAAPPATAT